MAKEDFKKRVSAFFEANRSKYDLPEKISGQVIVVNFVPGNVDAEKKALDKILDIQKKIGTEDFGSLAKKFSEDLGTKNKNGDLGYFSRGEKAALEQAAFSLEVGKVSGPVKGFTSYQLVKLTDRKPLVKAELVNAERKIAGELLGKDKFETLQNQLADGLKTGQIAAVNTVLQSMNLNWEETGFFSLDANQIPKLTEKELKAAAFELSPNSRLSKNLISVRNLRYVLMLKEIKSVEAEKNKNEARNVSQQAAVQLQDDWIRQFRNHSNVKINPLVVQ